jgi:TonB family protein
MFPQNMSRPEFYPDDLSTDPTSILEQRLLAGFPPDLALDLVLNELVVHAAEATRATAAALALSRGDEMVCRAATGPLAPDLGVPLNTRDGLSGACLQTRQPQLSVDTEFDPRIDPAISRRLGIRSILIVPIFDALDHTQFTGILEVFSSSPAAFSHRDQKSLEGFADECARIRQFATEVRQHKPSLISSSQSIEPKFQPPEILPAEFHLAESDPADFSAPVPPVRQPGHEAWALVLGALTILAAVAISFLIGSRIGWLNPAVPTVSRQISQPDPVSTPAASTKAAPKKPVGPRATTATKPATAPNPDELVVYEKGKVVFRSNDSTKREPAKSAPRNPDSVPTDAIVTASATTKREPAKSAPGNPDTKPTDAIVTASPTTKPEPAKTTRANPDSVPTDAIVTASATTKREPAKNAPGNLDSVRTDAIVTTSSTTKREPAKNAQANSASIPTDAIVAASSTKRIAKRAGVWLSADEAEDRLVNRIEPEYPADALASHRSGNVVLELLVSEDGSVASIHTVSGDPLLATAATEAIRNWRYQPYRPNERPSQFHTDVTMTFTLPN